MWRQDWIQLKKNLELERNAWALFEARAALLKEETAEAIDRKRQGIERQKAELDEEFRRFKEQKEAALKRKLRWALREYSREVERKFKPSVVLS